MVYNLLKFTYFLCLSPTAASKPARPRRGCRRPGCCCSICRWRFESRALRSRFDGMCSMGLRDVVILDFGGVLIDWNPRHLYRKLFDGDEPAMEHFLATVCTQEWTRAQDAVRLVAEAARLLKQQHADKAELIDAFYGRFDEMMAGPI